MKPETPKYFAPRMESAGENSAVLTMPVDYRDGDARVTVGWSDEDDCWIAEVGGVEAEIGGIHHGSGKTQTDALCDLCVSLLCLANALYNLNPNLKTDDPRNTI